MGLVKTRRLAAMHPPSLKLRRTRKQQRAKAGMKPPVKKGGNIAMGIRPGCGNQPPRCGR